MQSYNFEHKQGDDYNQTLIFKNSDGSFVNLTGSLVKFTIKRKVNGEIVIQKTLTVIDAIQGKVKVSLSNTETNTLSWTYVFDYELTDATGIVTTILWGKMTILSDIT